MSKIETDADTSELLQLTSEIVSSHVSNNQVQQDQLQDLIRTVYSTLHDLSVQE
ncbi:MAG: MucR family transcriptional regulator, partial [Pseudomonadota bacterium]